MKIYLNSKVGSIQECIEKQVKDCKRKLRYDPENKKSLKRLEEIRKFLDENQDLGIDIIL